MKGDFSKWEFDPLKNYTEVLQQQGRALLDQDWNAAQQIAAHLRQFQGRDTIGPNVAAVPAEVKDSFKVVSAHTDGTDVDISLNPGRVWVNGRLLQVDDTVPYTVEGVTYLGPPIDSPQPDASTIAAGVRDAVILQVWEEAFSAFQDPQRLLESALGGVDTTERAKLCYAIKLLRLEAGDECGNLVDKLADDFSVKGTLTVTADTVTLTGDCPVEAGGGYTGFEHYLFRIEIAEPDGDDNARFKWSRFNGGLVGRGTYNSTTEEVTITANDQMINHCGLNSFYLEALREDDDGGGWSVVMTADAVLSSDGVLSLSNSNGGSWPGDSEGKAFFRLWDGIDLISAFPVTSDPDELVSGLGIRVQFDAAAADNSNYTPGDYWTFPLRAVGAVDFDPEAHWPQAAPPEGVHYHRVPLAVLTWNAAPTTTLTAPGAIHDCRRVFQPLTRLDDCCTYTVGDGMRSYGDFDSIQSAVNHLPAGGGRICVLPGEYPENVVINKDNVRIHGCGPGSHLVSPGGAPSILIDGRHNIMVSGLWITPHNDQVGVLIDNTSDTAPEHIVLKELTVECARHSAIEVRDARYLVVCDNAIRAADVAGDWHSVFITADDVLVEHNHIAVVPGTNNNGDETVEAGRGGLHIGGTSERVRIIDNLIEGGIGNGITLGSVIELDADGQPTGNSQGWIANKNDPCDPCAPGTTYVPPDDGTGDTPVYQSAGALYDVLIERNRILSMGLNGIAVLAFFNLDGADRFISVSNLCVLGNSIRGCLRRELEQIPDEMQKAMGYGGIALADVDNLVVHDNHIVDNGPNHLEPVCGIYVLHAEGVDICRNRILNNGAKTENSANGAKPGPRAGIFIQFATAPKYVIDLYDEGYPRQNGVPAVKVHDNIVAQPLGRALAVTALGPVSVQGNQLTTQGFAFRADPEALFASTVSIFNLGISNELYLQQVLFSGETLDDLPVAAAGDIEFIVEAQPGLDTQRMFGYLGNGNILFSDNQVMLDLMDRTGFKFGVTSILIATLDDLAFEDNQCDMSFDFVFDEFFLSHSFMMAWTTRVTGNRFKEAIVGTLFSGVIISLFANHTVLNQATHCLQALNLFGAANLVKNPNSVLFDIFGLCRDDDRQSLLQQGTTVLAQANQQPQSVLNLF